MITLQFLEPAPGLELRSPADVLDRLRRARERLPFTHLLIGWQVPPRLLKPCRAEADRLGLRFLRWQPLLCADGVFQPHPEWQVVGARGLRVPGFRGLPEFTFACPNHPEVQESLLERLEQLASQGLYQGFFLDRVRFPSPAADPVGQMGCFCVHCQRRAAEAGLDLEAVRGELLTMEASLAGRQAWVSALLGGSAGTSTNRDTLQRFLDFRAASITRLVTLAAQALHQRGLEVGLDCFSPGLCYMVGQRLESFAGTAGWIKGMTYAHAWGPSTLPFELSGLHAWLAAAGMPEVIAMQFLGQALGVELPASPGLLRKPGLSGAALRTEVERGVQASPVPFLAGIELVELPGVCELDPESLRLDLLSVQAANPAGLALSWDLWHMPLRNLMMVGQVLKDDLKDL